MRRVACPYDVELVDSTERTGLSMYVSVARQKGPEFDGAIGCSTFFLDERSITTKRLSSFFLFLQFVANIHQYSLFGSFVFAVSM